MAEVYLMLIYCELCHPYCTELGHQNHGGEPLTISV